jgi:hypothetical protein
MLFSTTQLSCVHHLEEHSIHLHANGVELKQVYNPLSDYLLKRLQ